jgi:tyrosine-protein phosphatase SIW14
MRSYVALLSVFAAFANSLAAQTPTVNRDLPNFQKINDNLYRGGQPNDAGFADLKRLGIMTVIDLRDNDDKASKKRALVEKAGMRFINFPLDNWARPSVSDIEKILDAVNSPANRPVFIHCKRGSDRTGTVIAVYRMTHDGWNAKRAGDEAEKFGIGWWQFAMRDFINDYYRDRVEKK